MDGWRYLANGGPDLWLEGWLDGAWRDGGTPGPLARGRKVAVGRLGWLSEFAIVFMSFLRSFLSVEKLRPECIRPERIRFAYRVAKSTGTVSAPA